ncbi:hypothetical protein GI482_00320 [Bacillus sp. N3536]|nr:hypothetical protein GI482_00320 [Bacillus sp. N3536]
MSYLEIVKELYLVIDEELEYKQDEVFNKAKSEAEVLENIIKAYIKLTGDNCDEVNHITALKMYIDLNLNDVIDISPEELINEIKIRKIIFKEILPLYKISSLQFAELNAKLLNKMGFFLQEVKSTDDGGVEMLTFNEMSGEEKKHVIQCKKNERPVGVRIIEELLLIVELKKANNGILISDNSFTSKAIDLASDNNLKLIDGKKFRELLSTYKIKLY